MQIWVTQWTLSHRGCHFWNPSALSMLVAIRSSYRQTINRADVARGAARPDPTKTDIDASVALWHGQDMSSWHVGAGQSCLVTCAFLADTLELEPAQCQPLCVDTGQSTLRCSYTGCPRCCSTVCCHDTQAWTFRVSTPWSVQVTCWTCGLHAETAHLGGYFPSASLPIAFDMGTRVPDMGTYVPNTGTCYLVNAQCVQHCDVGRMARVCSVLPPSLTGQSTIMHEGFYPW